MDDNHLQRAILLLKSGQKQAAGLILQRAIQLNPQNEFAWLWYVDTLETDSARLAVLRVCLRFNPNSEAARRGVQVFIDKLAAPNQSNVAQNTTDQSQHMRPEPDKVADLPYTEGLFSLVLVEPPRSGDYFGRRGFPDLHCDDCGEILVACASCGFYSCMDCDGAQCVMCQRRLPRQNEPDVAEWHRAGFTIVEFVDYAAGDDDSYFTEEEAVENAPEDEGAKPVAFSLQARARTKKRHRG